MDINGDVLSPTTPLLNGDSDTILIRTYKRRWWILLIYSTLACVQNIFWLTYNTIGSHVNSVLDISDDMANVISMLGPIWYVALAFQVAWLVDNYGVRKAILYAAGCILFCGLLRCAMFGPKPIPMIVVMVAQSANAIAGPLLNSVPAVLSTTWFPPKERAAATAIGFISQNVGSAFAFLLGNIVQDDWDIWNLLYLEAIIAVATTVPVFIYFPERPPTPPSASSAELRTGTQLNVWQSIKTYFWSMLSTLKNWPFVMLLLAGGVSTGVSGGWVGILTNILKPLGYSVPETNGIGTATTLAATIGGIIAGVIADRFPRHLKPTLIAAYVAAAATLIWFLATILKWIPGSPYWMAITSVSLSCFFGAAGAPIIFEANLELTYPAPQALSGSILTWIIALFALIFMAAKEFVDSVVINWVFFGSLVFAVLVIAVTPIHYKRLDIDVSKGIIADDEDSVPPKELRNPV